MIRKGLLAAAAALLVFAAAIAEEGKDLKVVWGGGPIESSAYSGVYVPHLIKVLEQNRLAGYHWGGVSQGTVENAERVTDNPTHLAVGQLDILSMLKDQPIPGRNDGSTYQFTFVQKNMGPECLYLVTSDPNYETFGHVLGNAWDLTVVTGGEKSGSYGTWKVLQEIYPDLQDVAVEHVGNNGEIIENVRSKPGTFGFFIMRPDPASDIFEKISKAKLTLVPVVDFDLEGRYEFKSLKVSYGGLFGIGGEDQYHSTACTSVALITGDPNSTNFATAGEQKRLAATIDRLAGLGVDAFKPDTTTWRDMFDSIADLASEKTKELMDHSKQVAKDLIKGQAG